MLLEALANPDCGWFYKADANGFEAIPGSPIAYWASDSIRSAFSGTLLSNVAKPLQGLSTADNKRFLRFWWEPSLSLTSFSCESSEDSLKCGARWFPCAKGGEFRKWYGNIFEVVNWEKDGVELKSFEAAVIRNSTHYFKEGVTWTKITSSTLSARYVPIGCIFTDAGPLLIDDGSLNYCYYLALMNSPIIDASLRFIAPTLNYSNGDIGRLPLVFPSCRQEQLINGIVEMCIDISRDDWDAFEGSRDFSRHPLL